MSVPHIPNLNSFRRGGGRGRGRGRGGSTAGTEESHETTSLAKDRIIRSTDNDAATSRLSAVEAGYLRDPFAKLLAHGGGPVERRLPLMNRGTYVRTTAIDRLIHGSLNSEDRGARQIISLGAGSDTRFFRLKQEMPDVPLLFHELDFPSNTAAKIRQVLLPPFIQAVRSLCGVDLHESTTSMSSGDGAGGEKDSLSWTDGKSAYHIHPVDLRSLRRTSESASSDDDQFSTWGVSSDVPTLILSECCLIYLPPDDADSVLSYLIEAFSPKSSIGIVIYEPIRPNDAFGRTMVSNLTARGIHLQTLHAHDTLAAQRKRLKDHGVGGKEIGAEGGAEAADVDFLWEQWIAETERERVEKLEWMDEVEEWKLLARHYAVAWGWRDCGSDVFRTWKNLPVQTEDD